MSGDSTLRILLVTSDKFPPFRPAAKAIFGEELTGRGHVIEWIMPASDSVKKGGPQRYGTGTVYLAAASSSQNRTGRLVKHLREFKNDMRVFSLARRQAYDVIQVKDRYMAAVLSLIAARLNGSKFCYWLAYPHPEENLYSARQKIARYPFIYWLRGHIQSFLLYRILLPRADHVFVQSAQMRRDIAARGIDRAKITPVPGSLNLESVPYQGEADHGPSGSNELYVGTLIRKRRLDFVIRAFAKVAQQNTSAKLIFVGAGQNLEDEEMLRQEVQDCSLESRVEFVGQVPMPEIWKYIEAAAVYLSPYFPTFVLNSTSPTKLIEYMAMARPVVANDHPEQSLVLAESKAGICVPWDESRFAGAIIELLQNPDEIKAMGRRGRAWVESNRTNSKMADLVESTYVALTSPIESAAISDARSHGDAR